MKEEKPPISETLSKAEAKRRMESWGIPDWRSNNGYPHPSKTPKEVWRWEFLRRDWDYRDLWREWYTGQGIDPSIYKLMDYGLYELLDPRLPYKKLPKKHEHIFQQYPAVLNTQGQMPWQFPETTEAQDDDIENILNDHNTDRFVDIRIDLKRPLSPQLESEVMRKTLELRQKNLVGNVLRHRVVDEPVKYLRAIDATFLRVSKPTIGKEIFGYKTRHGASTRGSQVSKMMRRF